MLYPFKLPQLLFLFLLFFSSCKEKSSSANQAILDPSVVEIPEDFPIFYNTFHIDPEFQLNHIVFPLAGKSETEKWTLEEWDIHQPFPDDGAFKRDYENFAGIITETIIDDKGMFYFIRRFSKMEGEWQLIYYHQGTNLDGFIKE